MKNEKQARLDGVIEDLVSDLMYYDREEDEDMPRGFIEEQCRKIPDMKYWIVERFRNHLFNNLR